MVTAQKLPAIVNGVNVDNLFTTIDAVKSAPTIAKFKFRIQNRWEGGSQNRSTINEFHGVGQEHTREKSFVLHSDEPVILLGQDAAANPVEYLLHALAACVTTSMVYHAAARGIQIEAVESSFEGDIDLHGFLGLDPNVKPGYDSIACTVRLKGNGSAEQFQAIHDNVRKTSPNYFNISQPIAVNSKLIIV